MVTRDMVEGWLREAFLSQYVWLAQYMADLTNLLRPPDEPPNWNPDEKALDERAFQQLRIQREVFKLNQCRSLATVERGTAVHALPVLT